MSFQKMACFEPVKSWGHSPEFVAFLAFQDLSRSSVRTTLIRVKNISRIDCLDRRVSVAPMMDWSD